MQEQTEDGRRAFLSTLPAQHSDTRLAFAVTLASLVVFFAAAPFAKLPLPAISAFLPIYQSAVVLCDLITAVLLFGQFTILRWRALLVLACAYLFSACMAVAHAVSFPGLFAPGGLLGSGPQTTAWLYFLWHGLFPLLVIGYVLLEEGQRRAAPVSRGAALEVLIGVAATLSTAFGLFLAATAGHSLLPVIMSGDLDAPAKLVVAAGTWVISLVTLTLLWRRRPHSLLDLWLMVVMIVWIFDSALAAVLNHGRYDLGWYAGRIYGLLGSGFVLIVLLVDNQVLYGRLAAAHGLLQAANKELESFAYSVSHDLRAPLRAVEGYARMLEEDSAPKLDDEGRRQLAMIRSGSRQMDQLIQDLLALSRLGRQALRPAPLDMAALARETLSELPVGKARVAIGELPAASGDRALLKQVWVNLLSNAIKYSGRRDAPEVKISGVANNEQLVYCVQDNGAGFDMRYADKLFGVFQRLHRPEEFPGTGVGLAIVQRIVARHGGRVWAEGKPNEGAIFFFSLPGENTS
jgi:signal transduction histidine kinase